MFGPTELEQLRLQKQALLLESKLNRHALVLEVGELRAGLARVSDALAASRRFAPLLMGLASVAGFLALRGVRRPVSLIPRVAKLAKWVGPGLSLWRTFSAARRREPAAP